MAPLSRTRGVTPRGTENVGVETMEAEDEKAAGRWLSNINVVSWTSHTLPLLRRSRVRTDAYRSPCNVFSRPTRRENRKNSVFDERGAKRVGNIGVKIGITVSWTYFNLGKIKFPISFDRLFERISDKIKTFLFHRFIKLHP